MPDKKKDKDEKTSEQEALEKQIDAMMDPKLPDSRLEPNVPSDPPAPGGSKTAPQLPDKLRKQLGVDDKPPKPITIDKLDELTERIAGPKPAKPRKKEVAKPEDPEPEAPKKPVSVDDVAKRGVDLDDVRTDEAVDDIVSYEGDVMLAIADSTAAERNRRAETEAGTGRKKGTFSAFLWFLVFAIAVIALVLLGLLVTGGNVNSIKL